MSEVEQLLKDIEKLRDNLNKIAKDKKYNLQDQEVLEASRTLNECLTEYNKIVEKKIGEKEA